MFFSVAGFGKESCMERKRVYTLLFILLFAYLSATGCKRGEGKATMTIKVAGSTTVLPVVSRAAEVFMKIHQDVTITINSGGSGVGVTSVAKGLADIGMISRDITQEEKKISLV